MSEETSGEIRIMARLAEMRDEFHAEIKAVRIIATGKRAEESHEIELHGERIDALEISSASHAAQLLEVKQELMTCNREIRHANAASYRMEKKINALLEKWGIEDPAASPTDTPRLTRPKP